MNSRTFNLFFCGDRLLVNCEQTAPAMPKKLRPEQIRFSEKFLTPDGNFNCTAHELTAEVSHDDGLFVPIRDLFDASPSLLYMIAQQGRQLLFWRESYRFCSRCGAALIRNDNEQAMTCRSCGLDFFPRINPAIIVRVTRGEEILLALREGRGSSFYSVLAGFLEPGETLEECVRREVREEVGLDVTEIQYLRSQAWPFPNNVMIGFSAKSQSGQINPDGVEVRKAAWFRRDSLPNSLPRKASIASWLIRDFFKVEDFV